MYHLFAIRQESDVWDEIPYELREWWMLVKSDTDKARLLDWHFNYKRCYSYKLVTSDRPLKEVFYPREEIKTRSQTAQMLKAIGYKG